MNYGCEQNRPGVKRLVQVSEEVQKPVHVPVVLGNECFIITQQDIRKIEDIRLISYHKLGPNGELIPIETLVGQDIALRDAITNAERFQNQNQSESAGQLLEMLRKCCGQNQPAPTQASIAQQMEWAQSCSSTTPAYPFTYSKSTTTTDPPCCLNPHVCCKYSCCCTCQPKYLTHQGCNTMENDPNTEHIEGPLSARQMLKIRKITADTMGI